MSNCETDADSPTFVHGCRSCHLMHKRLQPSTFLVRYSIFGSSLSCRPLSGAFLRPPALPVVGESYSNTLDGNKKAWPGQCAVPITEREPPRDQLGASWASLSSSSCRSRISHFPCFPCLPWSSVVFRGLFLGSQNGSGVTSPGPKSPEATTQGLTQAPQTGLLTWVRDGGMKDPSTLRCFVWSRGTRACAVAARRCVKCTSRAEP